MLRTRSIVFIACILAILVSAPVHAAVVVTPLITGVSSPTAYVDPPDGLPHRLVAQQSGSIVDKVRHDTPSQIKFAKVMVGYDQIRGSGRITVQCTMDMKNAIEIGTTSWPWDSSKSICLDRWA